MVARKPHALKEWQRFASQALKPLIPNAAREAQLLLMHHLGCDELFLLTNSEKQLPNPQIFLQNLRRRMENEPLEYITNRVDFYGEEFYVDPGALIPRPETEHLIDEVLKRVEKREKLRFVEVGVGSGIISITLAKKLPKATFLAVDISKAALKVARKNIKRFGLEDRITLKESDLLSNAQDDFDYLVSNPPYIEEGFVLESNLSYEPKNALFGGEKGDEIIRELLDETLKRGIKFFTCEIGYNQKDTITSYLQGKPYKSLEFYKDYAGFDRGFTLRT